MQNDQPEVKLPPLGSFLIERFLDCRYSNPKDPASKATSTHLGARIAYHIASHTGLYIMKTYDELAELFCISPTSIKGALGGLRKAELIEVRTTRVSREKNGLIQDFRGGNVTSLIKPATNWYCSDKYIVNESTARAVVRARAYAFAAIQKHYPDLYFDVAFIATGKLKYATKENVPTVRADFYLCSGQKRVSLGLKTTQHKELNKDLLEVLKKEKYLRPDQGTTEVENLPESEAGDQLPETNTQTPPIDETNELTKEGETPNLDHSDQPEDQTMIPKHPKLSEKPKKEAPKQSAAELAAKLETTGRVKPGYSAKADTLKPTNKKDLKDACRMINKAAVPQGSGAPHYSHTAFVETLAKRISALKNERKANYAEAIKLTAFAMKNYAAYHAFLSQGSSQSINPNLNLKVIYRSAHVDDVIQFAAKHASRYESFDLYAWTGQSQERKQEHFDRKPVNPVGAPPTRTGRTDASQPQSNNKPKSTVKMNDIAAQILGGE
ncbi:winged helix-turn-helix DNA-binding domain protein [Vibrio phage vB_VcaS_HC]|nr:winged helix-turn-helix DNA-binding domain protein [Vibrio phage vB_VcaS_HC]